MVFEVLAALQADGSTPVSVDAVVARAIPLGLTDTMVQEALENWESLGRFPFLPPTGLLSAPPQVPAKPDSPASRGSPSI